MGKFSSVQYNSSDDVINSYGMKISGSVTAFGNNAGRISVSNPDITDGIDFGAISLFYQSHYANIYSKIDMGTDQGVMHGRGSIHGEIHSGLASDVGTLGLISGVVGRVTETTSGRWDMSSGVTGISSAEAMNTEGGGVVDGTYGVVSIGNAYVKGNLNVTGTLTATVPTATTATTATNVTVTDTSTENNTKYITMVDGFSGAQGIESDQGLLYHNLTGFLSNNGGASFGGGYGDSTNGGLTIDLSGNLSMDGNLVVGGYIRASGNITAYYSSDINLKDNIRPIENALFKVKQLKGIEFDWNDKAGEVEREKGHDVGLIAQEVEKVLPEIVQTREDGIKAIQYDKVTTLLVQAIKEQQELIEELQEKVERLENK